MTVVSLKLENGIHAKLRRSLEHSLYDVIWENLGIPLWITLERKAAHKLGRAFRVSLWNKYVGQTKGESDESSTK